MLGKVCPPSIASYPSSCYSPSHLALSKKIGRNLFLAYLIAGGRCFGPCTLRHLAYEWRSILLIGVTPSLLVIASVIFCEDDNNNNYNSDPTLFKLAPLLTLPSLPPQTYPLPRLVLDSLPYRSSSLFLGICRRTKRLPLEQHQPCPRVRKICEPHNSYPTFVGRN